MLPSASRNTHITRQTVSVSAKRMGVKGNRNSRHTKVMMATSANTKTTAAAFFAWNTRSIFTGTRK